MEYPIWTISGRFCGKVIDDQVYDENGHHVGYIDDGRIFSVRTGKVIGEFYREDRVGLKTSKAYPVSVARGIRGSRGFARNANKVAIVPAGWEDPIF